MKVSAMSIDLADISLVVTTRAFAGFAVQVFCFRFGFRHHCLPAFGAGSGDQEFPVVLGEARHCVLDKHSVFPVFIFTHRDWHSERFPAVGIGDAEDVHFLRVFNLGHGY